MKFDGVSGFLTKTGASLASLVKVALMSRGASWKKNETGHALAILGNGPSLRHTLDTSLDQLLTYDLMAVNFAALAPDFLNLRPRFYMLADGHFFNGMHSDPNVRKLWENLERVSWEMTLLVPSKYKHFVKPLVMNASHINLHFFNLTPVDGYGWLKNILFSSGLGMPRPRNVLIPAIMEGIRMGYNKILLFGADHSWTKTLDVDKENFVVSVQPHFYEDNEKELHRQRETYKGLHLHDVLGSMTIAFRSYWDIARFAKSRNIEIINATPGSMIDAFPRLTH